jgi:hypothetical protein
MTHTVRTFLIVSAAYLLGGSAAALAEPVTREAATGGVDSYAWEEAAGGEAREDDIHARLPRPEVTKETAP